MEKITRDSVDVSFRQRFGPLLVAVDRDAALLLLFRGVAVEIVVGHTSPLSAVLRIRRGWIAGSVSESPYHCSKCRRAVPKAGWVADGSIT